MARELACFCFLLRLPAVSSSPHPCCSVEKIAEIDTHIGVAISGLTADATTLIDHARVEAQYHTFTYDEPIKVESLTQSVCDLKMRFGEGSDGDKSKPKMVEFLPAACHPCSFSRVRSTFIVHYFSFPFLCPPLLHFSRVRSASRFWWRAATPRALNCTELAPHPLFAVARPLTCPCVRPAASPDTTRTRPAR